MQGAWTKHLRSPEDINQFKKDVLGSKRIFDRLRELLKEMEGDLTSKESDYTSPAWAYQQAHILGFKECLRKVDNYINLDQEKQ